MPRPKKPPEEDNPLRWLATYGDVVTLMMAFFVMLYAISQVDQQKFQLFVSGLKDVFQNEQAPDGILEGGDAIVGASSNEPEEGDAGVEGVQVLDGLPRRDDNTPPPPPPEEVEGSDQELLDISDLIAVRDAISSAFAASGVETRASFDLSQRGLVVSVATDDVLFRSGGHDLSESGRDIVRIVGPILEDFDNQVLIEGHTDSVPLNGGGYTNWNLSSDRALAVLQLLLAEFEIAPQRLAATGFGEYRPVAPNETDEGKAANRRVELVIVAVDTGISDEDLIGQSPADESQADVAQADQTEPDQTETDQTETDQAQTDQAQTDQALTERASDG